MAIAFINGAASPIAGAIKAAAHSTGTSWTLLSTLCWCRFESGVSDLGAVWPKDLVFGRRRGVNFAHC
jgi:hypothetical protein